MQPPVLIEPERFFASPRRTDHASAGDAQTAAVRRLLARCEALRPHLQSVGTLEAFIQTQPDPARTRQRIGLALAAELCEQDRPYGLAGRSELEAFRALAQQRLAAMVWVFG